MDGFLKDGEHDGRLSASGLIISPRVGLYGSAWREAIEIQEQHQAESSRCPRFLRRAYLEEFLQDNVPNLFQ